MTEESGGRRYGRCYNSVVNPLFIVAPVVAGLMLTAANLKSDYDRAQLRLLPPTPLTPINIVISEQYARIVINENAPTLPPVKLGRANTKSSIHINCSAVTQIPKHLVCRETQNCFIYRTSRVT